VLVILPLAAQEDWPAAIQLLKKQVRSNRGDENARNQLAIAHNNYAMALGQEKKWEEATSQMEEALRLDRQNARFKENLSLVHLNHAYQLYQEPNSTQDSKKSNHEGIKSCKWSIHRPFFSITNPRGGRQLSLAVIGPSPVLLREKEDFEKRLLSLLTEVEAEFHPPQAGVTEVGAAEGIPKVEGEFLAGDIADIQSC